MASATEATLPILDLSLAGDPRQKPQFLEQLHDALFNVGFLYIKNHGVPADTISNLVSCLPALFDQPTEAKAAMSKINSPHFLGYSGYAEEVTLGVNDLREQFDFATELPVIWQSCNLAQEGSGTTSYEGKDLSKLYWRLRGPNQWPSEELVPGFRNAYTEYHNSLQSLSHRLVHLIEEAFGIPVGTFDAFFQDGAAQNPEKGHISPQHRIKLVKYPPSPQSDGVQGQGVGAHKDSSGWLTLLLQVGEEKGLEVLGPNGEWIAAPPISGTFVVNFGNALEAATEGAVRATIHCVKAPSSLSNPRYSVPFFMGLPLDLTVSQIRSYIPESVKSLRNTANFTKSGDKSPQGRVSDFLDPRWDSLGDSQLRKWIRSHEDIGRKFYGDEVVQFYLS